jgi:hypothetical protein
LADERAQGSAYGFRDPALPDDPAVAAPRGRPRTARRDPARRQAIPEQITTARFAAMPVMVGHAAFIDGSLAIAVFGATHPYPTVDAAVRGFSLPARLASPGWGDRKVVTPPHRVATAFRTRLESR